MIQDNEFNPPSQDSNHGKLSNQLFEQAEQSCAKGCVLLGIHLYLAAFECVRGIEGSDVSQEVIEGLKKAWVHACTAKERSLAECIFDRLEPYLNSAEIMIFVEQLQELALDKLDEFGLSREDLEDMSEMISQNLNSDESAFSMRLEHVVLPSKEPSKCACSSQEGCGCSGSSSDTAQSSLEVTHLSVEDIAARISEKIPGVVALGVGGIKTPSDEKIKPSDRTTYSDISGYGSVIAAMGEFGIGRKNDKDFQDFVRELNAHHGLESMPAPDVLLFRSQAREDASYFMNATAGELDLPVLRMRMTENAQGAPVLNVMAQVSNHPKLNPAKNGFEGSGILILEDLDSWISPLSENNSDDSAKTPVNMSRGAREAITLIRSGVEHPDVYVFASLSDDGEIPAFFFDLLDPFAIVDIEYPTLSERVEIWNEIMLTHPSLRYLDQVDLVRFSSRMPRYDIFMAAREAVEDSYRLSLVTGKCESVSLQSVLEKLAAYQPLESNEYQALEDAVVLDFRKELDNLEDLLAGDGR